MQPDSLGNADSRAADSPGYVRSVPVAAKEAVVIIYRCEVVGRPAAKVRALSPEEIVYLRYSAEHYVRVKNNYLLTNH